MKAEAVILERLINGERVFVIPNFQRRYRWQRTQWALLFEDLLRETELGDSAKEGHFLGSLVIHQSREMNTAGVDHWMVIDGQQRLTTVLLLLAAMRDLFIESYDQAAAQEIEERFLSNKYADPEFAEKLRPTPLDREQYLATIRDGAPAGRFGEGYDYFKGRLSTTIAGGHVSLRQVLETLKNRMLVVRIFVDQRDAINSIFNTLNSKGLPLNAGDLIKNELLLAFTDEEAQELYNNVWAPIEDELVLDVRGKVDDRKLVTFFWARELPYSKSVTKKDLFTVFEERHRKLLASHPSQDPSTEAARVELANIASSFETYRKIDDHRIGRRKLPEPVYQELQFFKSWTSDLHIPLSMWIVNAMERHPDRVSVEDAARALGALRSFLVRRALAGLPTNNLNSMLSTIPLVLQRDILDATAPARLPELLISQLSRPGFHWPSNQEILNGIRTVPILKSIKLPQVRAILELASGTKFRQGKLQLVVPRNPDQRALNDAGLSSDLIDFGFNTLPYTLGNLFLPGELKETATPSITAARSRDLIMSSEKLGSVVDRIALRSDHLAQLVLDTLANTDEGTHHTSARTTSENTVQNLLALIPEKSWTTVDHFASVCQLSIPETTQRLDQCPAYHVRFVREEDGGILTGISTELSERISKEDFAAQARYTNKNRLSEDDLYVLIEEASDVA